MPSRRVVLFNGHAPYCLSGFRDRPSHLKGLVENGGWHLYIYKRSPDYWEVYAATSQRECTEENRVGVVHPKNVYWVEIPEVLRADYNTLIKWAQGRGEAERCYPRNNAHG